MLSHALEKKNKVWKQLEGDYNSGDTGCGNYRANLNEASFNFNQLREPAKKQMKNEITKIEKALEEAFGGESGTSSFGDLSSICINSIDDRMSFS